MKDTLVDVVRDLVLLVAPASVERGVLLVRLNKLLPEADAEGFRDLPAHYRRLADEQEK